MTRLWYTPEFTGSNRDRLLNLDSPALRELNAGGCQDGHSAGQAIGELVGLLNLGPRMSEQDYPPGRSDAAQ